MLYLDHFISNCGILPNPEKIIVMKSFPTPISIKYLCQLSGLAGYYQRFIPNFARVASSLTRQDIPIQWTLCCQQSLKKLKDLLTTPPVTVYPNFVKEFVLLHTDASGEGLGAILEHEEEDGQLYPIAYANRSINKYEK